MVLKKLTAAAAIGFALTTPSYAFSHVEVTSGVAIEHAELVPGPANEPERLFLTIANAGPDEVAISSISVSGYAAPILVQRRGSSWTLEDDIQWATLQIPVHAELFMDPSTLYLQLARLRGAAAPFMVYVRFGNDITISLEAKRLPVGSQPTDHHHGAPESEVPALTAN